MTKVALIPPKLKSDRDIEQSPQFVGWTEGGLLKVSLLARRLAQGAGLELCRARGRVVGS